MSKGESWIEGAKERVEAQKRMFREGGSRALARDMLKIGDTNFLVTPKQARIILALELACSDLRSYYNDDEDDWKWGGFIGDMAKIHQLGCGSPSDYRRQFVEVIEAEAKVEDKKKGVILQNL